MRKVCNLKIAICDDNNIELLKISKIVEEFIDAHLSEHSITYSAFQNGTDLLVAIEKGQVFDIFLLDVVMPLMNGIQLADEIRNKNTVSKIIFLTSAPEYAVDSYSVDAFYYLLKPIKKDGLIPLLEKAITDIFDKAEKHIIVKCVAGLSKIFLSKLQYAEVIGRTMCFHLKNGEDLESYFGTMSQLEAQLLPDKRFVKPHRSYIVNMDCIKNLVPEGITTVTGAFIPISRNIYKEVKQAYIDYSFDGVEKLCCN